jgi:hypothetical protein
MVSNLVTPPDIVSNELHSVLLVDPDQSDLDTVIKFCQYSDQCFNVYVYTPNMDNQDWLAEAVNACNAVIVNTKTLEYKEICRLEKTFYYGSTVLIGNQKKLIDPVHYFLYSYNLNK